ncbi:hypothetical protein JHL17_32645 [Azospirillum sp. YIM B02556]|uniref:Uncharacterized protein n=1 Tax=Azospirillum endophyticum TaxID=2800326 RepID=A0ABS1FFH1_9PROT|nr:hypothetical protein [Azospirillum endophyticum]MBK1842155.1 hypothetical protein [Azospirillum endophyticum]
MPGTILLSIQQANPTDHRPGCFDAKGHRDAAMELGDGLHHRQAKAAAAALS